MITRKDVIEFREALTYKGNFKIKIHLSSDKDITQMITIQVRWSATHINFPDKDVYLSTSCGFPLSSVMNKKDLQSRVIDMIIKAEAHEICEFLKVGGKQVFKAHQTDDGEMIASTSIIKRKIYENLKEA